MLLLDRARRLNEREPDHGQPGPTLRRRLHLSLRALSNGDREHLLAGDVAVVHTPSSSGKGQRIARCPRCHVAVWSHYAGAGDSIRSVGVGTLDEPDLLPPDVHIDTASRQPWVVLPPDVAAVPEHYQSSEVWPKANLERFAALRARSSPQRVARVGPRRRPRRPWTSFTNAGAAAAGQGHWGDTADAFEQTAATVGARS